MTTRRNVLATQSEILHFSLEALLPEGHILALNSDGGTLSQLCTDQRGFPRLLAQQPFTKSELNLLRPLFEHYPQYCPHEVMFANFYNGSVNEKTISRARERLHEAMEYGTWDYEMRPLRNVLSRARLKLKTFNIDARSLLETGYMLVSLSSTAPLPFCLENQQEKRA